jgi:long-chain acyl-CoA synthetase
MKTYENAYTEFDEKDVPEHMIRLQEAQTLDGLFRARVKRTPDAEAYRFFSGRSGAWQSMNWLQVADQVARWQSALNNEGLAPGDRVAVMMENCVYWVILDQAALALGLILVPLYANDRPDNLAYVLRDSGAKFLLIREQEQADKLERVADEMRHLILRSVLPVKTKQLSIVCVDDWLPEKGETAIKRHPPDSLASIVYTSGTTGHPKGVMLSHKNMLWNAWSGLHSMMVFPDDQHLSFLPLSHTLERTVGYYLMMMVGAKVAFNRSIPELAEDIQIIKPTIMITVPRIFERVHAKIIAKLDQESMIKRFLFDSSVKLGWKHFLIEQGRANWFVGQVFYPLLDYLVGAKIRQRLGGRLRLGIVGGAAMPEAIARVFLALGVPLLQGYGLTETSPIISVNALGHNDPKSVGSLLRDVEIKNDPATGELLIKGPGVMQGYWNREQATHEVIDENGWLKTGDITRYENDFLYITGRVKDIVVLATGEKVPPADIEAAIALDPLIEQIIVIGEGKPFLSALIVLNEGETEKWIKRVASKRSGTRDEILKEELKERIRDCSRDFPGYARIYEFAIVDEEWTIENELLTPTLKIKRARVLERYTKMVEGLYEGHS